MKLLKKSVCLLGLLFCFKSFAEPCTLTVQEFTPRSNCRETVKNYAAVEAEDWQSCFIKAVNLAHKIGYQRPARAEVRETRQCKQTAYRTPLQVIKWRFDDSLLPLMDSKGIVNTQTLEHVLKPETGNQAFDEGGGVLF